MSSLSAKDRVSLCSFTFSDGRRCQTPRFRNNPRFCPYHAQKEARARAAQKLGKDLTYFFSGDYLSACDLSTTLGRLIPAVIRGDVKPRAARTVAYLAQTLLQAIHISQHEYINAFGSDAWRQSVRNSVNYNHDYLFPPTPESQHRESSAPATATAANSPAPEPQQPASAAPSPHPQHTSPPPRSAEPPVNCHSERSEESASSSNSSLATHHSPPPQTPQPAPPPHTPLPPTSAEFVEQVLARLKPASSAPPATSPQPAQTPSCHSERSEEPAFYSSSAPSPASAQAPQTASPSSHVCHPGRTC